MFHCLFVFSCYCFLSFLLRIYISDFFTFLAFFTFFSSGFRRLLLTLSLLLRRLLVFFSLTAPRLDALIALLLPILTILIRPFSLVMIQDPHCQVHNYNQNCCDDPDYPLVGVLCVFASHSKLGTCSIPFRFKRQQLATLSNICPFWTTGQDVGVKIDFVTHFFDSRQQDSGRLENLDIYLL